MSLLGFLARSGGVASGGVASGDLASGGAACCLASVPYRLGSLGLVAVVSCGSVSFLDGKQKVGQSVA